MADMTPNRFGSINSVGDPAALFLKVFAGEVLTAFAEYNVALSRHMVRSISSGKSAQFPASWKGTASYHVPGVQLLGDPLAFNERIITIDSLLVADRAIANIDEAMTHYDIRSIYSRDIGMALARTFDQQVLQTFVLAARASATVTGGSGGSRIIDSTLAAPLVGAGVTELEESLFEAITTLDQKFVPEEDRYIFVSPATYYALIQGDGTVGSPRSINRDYNPNENGGYSLGKIYQLAGAEIVKTNNMPSTDIDTVAVGAPTTYDGDFTQVVAIVAQKGAVGTVKLIDLSVESEYLINYQTTLMVGKYALGHGILRPECAVELAVAATPTT